jgi:hypothetical protein
MQSAQIKHPLTIGKAIPGVWSSGPITAARADETSDPVWHRRFVRLRFIFPSVASSSVALHRERSIPPSPRHLFPRPNQLDRAYSELRDSEGRPAYHRASLSAKTRHRFFIPCARARPAFYSREVVPDAAGQFQKSGLFPSRCSFSPPFRLLPPLSSWFREL